MAVPVVRPLIAAVLPQMRMPPAARAGQQNKKGQQQRDQQGKFNAVLRCQIAFIRIKVKRKRQHQTGNQHQYEQG